MEEREEGKELVGVLIISSMYFIICLISFIIPFNFSCGFSAIRIKMRGRMIMIHSENLVSYR